jgi:hypothetical protein
VAHTCNPSCSRGRDQEDHGSEPTWANSLRDLSWKNPPQKRTGGADQSVGPEFKPQYWKKKGKWKELNCSAKHLHSVGVYMLWAWCPHILTICQCGNRGTKTSLGQLHRAVFRLRLYPSVSRDNQRLIRNGIMLMTLNFIIYFWASLSPVKWVSLTRLLLWYVIWC